MNSYFNITFIFIISISLFKTSISAGIERYHDFRIAEPNINAICQSYSKQVFYISHKIVCIFCKGFDVSCFPTTKPPTVSSTVKPPASSSVKSTFPVSSSLSVSSTKSAVETSTASEPPDA